MSERRVNLLLGRGETLLSKVDWPSSGSKKHYPYGITEQRDALHSGIANVVQIARHMQKEYAPRGEVTAKLTLHPEFLAKSYFPEALLNKSHLRLVGPWRPPQSGPPVAGSNWSTGRSGTGG